MRFIRTALASLGVLFMTSMAFSEILTVHYKRHEGDYNGWKLWVWNQSDGKPGMDVEASGRDSFGLLFRIDLANLGLDGKDVGILPRLDNWADKDAPDRIWKPGVSHEIFMVQGEPELGAVPPKAEFRLLRAYLDAPGTVRAVFSSDTRKDVLLKNKIALQAGDKIYHAVSVAFDKGRDYGMVAFITFDIPADTDMAALNRGDWKLKAGKAGERPVYAAALLDGKTYSSDKKLGAFTENGVTVIRVFAPSASGVTVLVKNTVQDQNASEYAMGNIGQGLWEYVFHDNLDGKYYRLRAARNGKIADGLDPYARSVTAHNGWALIVNDGTPVADGPAFDNSENIIYELHLRDMTIDPDSGVRLKGKYLGMAEEGTRSVKNHEIKTALDHVLELGVNTVHIMPVQDFENDEHSQVYNWGYMPVNFNSPDGWYATETSGPARVRELKTLIDVLHNKGIKVVLDVVYNHTAETAPDITLNFNALTDSYYYRRKNDGSYYNGSGCGNEFRTESPMGRRFIIDSLVYWAREYKVDGFRFDLMGLIDMQTIEESIKALRAVNPNIFVYGEPWAAGDTPIKKTEKGAQRSKGFALFSDTFRDSIKGSVFNLGPGYVQAGTGRENVMKGITGSIDEFTDSPQEVINYVSCHDNHTLWDRLVLSTTAQANSDDQIAMDKLAQAIVLTSQGVPFLHAGEEFLRTKKGHDNSYNLPDDINMMDWGRKKTYFDVFEYYKGLVALRRAHPAFRMKTADAVRRNLKFYEEQGLTVTLPCIAYTIDGRSAGDSWTSIVVLINPSAEKREFQLPRGDFKIAVNKQSVNLGRAASLVSRKVTVEPHSMMVLYSE